ncbi:hypothetical protein BZA05DRAFT_174794 [Tricharina praecox]|uniref:uncharacterized protein n=1 Tax=Tricharina praecox TaxID=43433 RepID=UPI00221F6FE7|nr:uncharacterized protein BZA05DRAFT_174794 [Tricharina praecox]KAI5844351.1 hypothetical protein BZA05DRAFT_174794 [Tricharina praecox]
MQKVEYVEIYDAVYTVEHDREGELEVPTRQHPLRRIGSAKNGPRPIPHHPQPGDSVPLDESTEYGRERLGFEGEAVDSPVNLSDEESYSHEYSDEYSSVYSDEYSSVYSDEYSSVYSDEYSSVYSDEYSSVYSDEDRHSQAAYHEDERDLHRGGCRESSNPRIYTQHGPVAKEIYGRKAQVHNGFQRRMSSGFMEGEVVSTQHGPVASEIYAPVTYHSGGHHHRVSSASRRSHARNKADISVQHGPTYVYLSRRNTAHDDDVVRYSNHRQHSEHQHSRRGPTKAVEAPQEPAPTHRQRYQR